MQVLKKAGLMEKIECPRCNGDGQWVTWTSNSFNPVISGKCLMCDGKGKIEVSETVTTTKKPK